MKLQSLLILVISVIAGYFILPAAVAPGKASPAVVFAIGIAIGGLFQFFFFAIAKESGSGKSSQTVQNFDNDGDTVSIYVGSLDFELEEDDVREFFNNHVDVISLRLMRDKETGKCRGFGFVELSPEDAEKAIKELNGAELAGRNIKVNAANERKSRYNRPRQYNARR